MTDILTFMEHKGSIEGRTVCWVGDANNMSYSWLEAAKILGFHINLAIPEGYPLDLSLIPEGDDYYTVYRDPIEAAKGADLVTTDVWTSMGFEEENEKAPSRLCQLSGQQRRDGGCQPRCALHALPARASRRRGDGRGDRRPAVRCVGRSGKSPACSKRHHGILP